MGALAIWCPLDGVLGTVAPLALAAAAGTALVVDVDPDGPGYAGTGSLAQLVDSGPRLADLRPARPGVAVLRNGGVALEDAAEVLTALIAGWPNVVFRTPRQGPLPDVPTVPVVPLLPGRMTRRHERAAVYQQVGWHEQAPRPNSDPADAIAGHRDRSARGADAIAEPMGAGVAAGVGVAVGVIDRLARHVIAEPIALDRAAISARVTELLPTEAPLLPLAATEAVVDALVGLGPIETLLRDPQVSDVLVNGDGEVWVERAGRLSFPTWASRTRRTSLRQ